MVGVLSVGNCGESGFHCCVMTLPAVFFRLVLSRRRGMRPAIRPVDSHFVCLAVNRPVQAEAYPEGMETAFLVGEGPKL